jgi:four helix bundle protein
MKTERRIYDLEDRLIDFVLKIDERIELLSNTRLANHLAGQIVRSASAPALNYGEAQSAESKKDFIHKMQVILKELRETRIWLKSSIGNLYLQKALFCQHSKKIKNSSLYSLQV